MASMNQCQLMTRRYGYRQASNQVPRAKALREWTTSWGRSLLDAVALLDEQSR